MNKAKKELDRLARVISYGVLDTEFERGYDDLVKLAASICQTPMAAISMVDETRIWFKARFQVEALFVPRRSSMCGLTVEIGRTLCIPDLLADSRTERLPSVIEAPYLRAYLGVPLLTNDGFAVGTLAVLDERAREFTPAQIEALEAIARQVISQLDLSAANRKLALSQERLNEERERFKNMVEDLNEVVFRADLSGRWTYLNPAWATLLGLDPRATLGEPILTRVHADDRPALEPKLRSLLEGSVASIRAQARMITFLGEEKIFEIFVKHCLAPDGSPFLAGTLTDLTELLSAHARSIEQEHYINSFYSSTEFFMGVVDLTDSDIIMVSGNPALQKIMLANSSLKFPVSGSALQMPRATIDFWRDHYLACAASGGRSSFDYQEVNGLWFRVYLAQVENKLSEYPRFSYIVADVTLEVERLRTIDAQRNLLQTISEHAGDVIWMADLPSGDIVFINKAYERIWGSSRAELLRDRSTFLQPIHEADRARVMAAMPSQPSGTYEEVYRVQSPSGERWVRDRAFPVKNAAGEIVQLVGIASDITEVRLQEEALRLQKKDLELVISHLPVAICVYDAEGVREFVNEEWSRCLGWSAAEVVGKPVDPALFVSEEGHREARAFRDEVGSPREFTVLTKDKTQKIILVSIVPLPRGKKMTVFRDLTHERRQEKLIEAQQETMIESARLSSLGEMAAGIAHEINNPLAIIQGSADLVHAALERGGIEPEKLMRSMERISSTVNRIAKIITGLKSFARDGSKDPFVPASLKTVVGEALELCQSRYRHNGVELTLDLPEHDVLVAARPVQLAQLLVNLLNNAFDAVEKQTEKRVFIGVKIEGTDACLRVLDNGPGVPPELRDKILQPFFTTKAPGKGTGLGLSLSRAIVEGHGGRLEIKTMGGLTCFEAALPLLPAA